MSSTCPAGHRSAADDYCDVCGLPIGEQTSVDLDKLDQPGAKVVEPVETPVDPAAEVDLDKLDQPGALDQLGALDQPEAKVVEPVETPVDPGASTCPNCQCVNPPNALFCEACGYDFTTGSLPRPLDPPQLPGAGSEAPAVPGVAAVPAAPAIEPGWVAEIWIDPDWYAAQESQDPLPSAGLPTVVPLRTQSLLVGRVSQSRGIHPDIDLSSDSGISRRHCQLTTDGGRWWVEDLGSSNGTYVADAVGPLPTVPLVQGQKRELDGDDRVYLGAWTRLFIRKAAPGEG